MSCIFRVTAFVFAVTIAHPAYADEPLTCPGHEVDQGKEHGLDHVSVFDGDPDDEADLEPDQGEWNLADYRRDDREMFLVCYYKKSKNPESFLIPRAAATCRLKGRNVVCS